MQTIVSISGGLGSAYALKLALDEGTPVSAVFADVKGTGYSHSWSQFPEVEYLLHERYGGEGRDTTRFIWQLSHALDTPIERVADGRSIWAIFAKTRCFRLYVKPKFVCKASELLKREAIARWLESHFEPGNYRIALGMNALEPHRITSAKYWWANRLGWEVEVYSPLIQEYERSKRFIDNCTVSAWLNTLEIETPSAYHEGLPHNNCKDCVMAGQSQFAALYRWNRNHYLYAAEKERQIRALGVNATILKITRNGVSRPITLYDFIALIESGDVNEKDTGATCGCFAYAPMARFVSEVPTKPKPRKRAV